MKNLSIVEKYTLLTLNDKGTFPSLSTNYPEACLLSSAISDLSLNEVISIDDKKMVTVVADLPENLELLRPFYDYLKDIGSLSIAKILQDYTMSFSKRYEELFQSISNSLAAKNSVEKEEKSGIIIDKVRYYPNKSDVESVVQKLRDEVLEKDKVSNDMLILSSILDRGKQLNQFFSKHESKDLKEKLELLRKTEASSLVKTMIDQLDALIVAMASISG